jgi:hypothetical protein
VGRHMSRPWPGKACCGSFRQLLHPVAQLRRMHAQVLRRLHIRYPPILIRHTTSSLKSRVNFRLSMTHLRSHQDTCLRNQVQAKFII